MTDLYVNSNGGLSTNSGASWATAKDTIANAIAAGTPGDTIYVAAAHDEANAGGVTLNFGSTSSMATPFRVICAATTGTPPTQAASTGVIRSGSGNSQLLTLAFSAQIYGLTFRANPGGTSSTSSLTISSSNNGNLRFDECKLELAGTGNSAITFGSSGANNRSVTALKNTWVKFAATGQRIVFNIGKFRWDGGGFTAGSVTPVDLISSNGAGTYDVEITGVDFSSLAPTFNVCAAGMQASGTIMLRDCRMPDSWTGTLVAGQPGHPGFVVKMFNCHGAGGSLAYWSEAYGGSVRSDTSTKKSGSDISLLMATNANSGVVPIETPDLFAVNTVVGSAKTVSVDIIHDGAQNLTHADIWLEVFYQSTSSPALAVIASDGAAPLAAPVAQDASTATWTTGLSGARKQKLSVTVTPQAEGVLIGKVVLAKPNTSVYVDNKLQVN